MADMMNFPKRWEDFLRDYEFEDARRIYTNGSRLIPSFGVKQMMEHYAPVRYGRWEEADWFEPDCYGFGTIRTPKAALRCSNCKNCFKKELLWKDNYCPNCGTDMRGSNDE